MTDTPRVGQRVRIVDAVEGIVTAAVGAVLVVDCDGFVVNVPPHIDGPSTRTVEVLPDPPPKWEPGHVIRVNNGTRLRGPEMWSCSYGDTHTDEQVNHAWALGSVRIVCTEATP